ncbi:gliding motility lipoprotein GldD [Salinimicrobium sp. TH3]|uniref:gliding motility lipoprotein GldD n=1 Tax=Salinimicrobium sp. TH3 TaxID=2997342 RepID=UPI002275CD0F|nr:gliding motility lipoprotein GldD [Salinimicrobium sp. TH3]MCY2686262.1 gliding motility lipoprotein GldD [Salinimicrobium sp. TH3]
MKKLIFLIFLGSLFSCGDEVQPKPNAYLSLDYPDAEYSTYLDENCPYSFEKNSIATVAPSRAGNECWVNIEYRDLKGTIFITYQPVRNNLDSLLTDAQKLPLQHTIKADAIEGSVYTNDFHNTYGMFYQVEGNAASQAQFYLTDSTRHFLTGSVYFEVQPNFDSILPAAAYLKEDIKHLMETVEWKDGMQD